jgi:fucose permease
MSIGIWQIIFILAVVVPYIPMIWVLKRAGRSRGLFFLFIIPIVNLIVLWVFAFGHWPALDDRPTKTS